MLCLDGLAKSIQIIEGIFAEALLDQSGVTIRTRDGTVSKLEGRLSSPNELTSIRRVCQLGPRYSAHKGVGFYPNGRHPNSIARKTSGPRPKKRVQNSSVVFSGLDLLPHPFRRETCAVSEPPVNRQLHVIDEGRGPTATYLQRRIRRCVTCFVEQVRERQLATSSHATPYRNIGFPLVSCARNPTIDTRRDDAGYAEARDKSPALQSGTEASQPLFQQPSYRTQPLPKQGVGSKTDGLSCLSPNPLRHAAFFDDFEAHQVA